MEVDAEVLSDFGSNDKTSTSDATEIVRHCNYYSLWELQIISNCIITIIDNSATICNDTW